MKHKTKTLTLSFPLNLFPWHTVRSVSPVLPLLRMENALLCGFWKGGGARLCLSWLALQGGCHKSWSSSFFLNTGLPRICDRTLGTH